MIQKHHRRPSVSNSRPHVRLVSLFKWKLLVRWYIAVSAPLRSGLTLLGLMSSSDWWIILSTAPLILSEDERWVVSWGSDGNTAVGKVARVCMNMLIPLKRNAPTLGSCISAQMAPSRKATLTSSKGTSKHWWFFRGPASFSGPSRTYKDYSCVHNTGCHTYTLWINWYYFHLVKG